MFLTHPRGLWTEGGGMEGTTVRQNQTVADGCGILHPAAGVSRNTKTPGDFSFLIWFLSVPVATADKNGFRRSHCLSMHRFGSIESTLKLSNELWVIV
ncbi:hypothetical protein TNIN_320381 [Trichonephila inaurata madagascariensis]|uniref:Uncharacterized protein n=1 Tax=Trichonephila inaurata madagascariensis TaxID=2747483 RepID=A0A8X6YBR2_9ARAC|nr:hypothetical protein TNIN_320381 [Trichonephila inaurata madagascariensis]